MRILWPGTPNRQRTTKRMGLELATAREFIALPLAGGRAVRPGEGPMNGGPLRQHTLSTATASDSPKGREKSRWQAGSPPSVHRLQYGHEPDAAQPTTGGPSSAFSDPRRRADCDPLAADIGRSAAASARRGHCRAGGKRHRPRHRLPAVGAERARRLGVDRQDRIGSQSPHQAAQIVGAVDPGQLLVDEL